MKDTSSPNATKNHFQDYEVHLLIEDKERNYLLKIGTLYERYSGEISGDTLHGTLIMRPLTHLDHEPDRFFPIKHCPTPMPRHFNGHLHA